MSHLPGNPHASDANMYAAEASLIQDWDDNERTILASQANVQATLALAYEQRTANLIAIQALGVTDLTDWLPEHADVWVERAEEIEKRLGEAK